MKDINVIADIEELIYEIYDLIREYEHILNDSVDPKEKNRTQRQISQTKNQIFPYLKTYHYLCRKLGVKPKQEIQELSFAYAPEIIDSPELGTEIIELPHTKLSGARIININISQLFRMADFLTEPDKVKAKEFYKTITSPSKLRRVLNDQITFSILPLGELKPTTRISEKFKNYWRPGVPDLRSPEEALCFVPFTLSLSNLLQNLRYKSESYVNEALLDSMIEVQNVINNNQLSGHLRIYPPGIGVIKIRITIEYKEEIHIELVSKIARNFEALLFIDPSGEKKEGEKLLSEIIEYVIQNLFEEGTESSERKWLPPTTTYIVHGNDDFSIDTQTDKLAYLMSLAPGNQELTHYLKNRIQRSLASSLWAKDHILTICGQNVALCIVTNLFAGGNKNKQSRMRDWLVETHELVSAAAYAQQNFFEEIQKLYERRYLDRSWLPINARGKERFNYLWNVLSNLRQTLQAVVSIKHHLTILDGSSGKLMKWAQDLWNYSNPIDFEEFRNGINYIRKDWFIKYKDEFSDKEIEFLEKVLDDIINIPPLFESQINGDYKQLNQQTQENLENEILTILYQVMEDEDTVNIGAKLRRLRKLQNQLGI